MTTAAPPDDPDQRRIDLLESYDILDTPPEPPFNDIVAMAAAVCRTPIALVSLIERDRQWFKARIGFEESETPIEQSVCAHSLASTDLLIIPDLTADPRTLGNELVTGATAIRFYAGAPLVAPDGTVVGTLCVIDHTSRPDGLDDTQILVLTGLARQVVALIEARRVSHRKDELFLRQKGLSASIRANASKALAAQEAGRVGTFEVDIATGSMVVSAEFCRIFDVPVAAEYHTSTFEALTLAEDRAKRSSEATRRDGSASTNAEYRIRTRNHGVRWIARHANFETDAQGRPTRLLGTVQDITEAKKSAIRTQAMLDLGDRIRDLDDVESIVLVASDLMAKSLDASRAGFGIVDPIAETVAMQPEWRAPGVASIAGPHHFRSYGSFIDDLKEGRTVVVSDVTEDARTRAHAEALLAIGIRVLVNLPIFDHGRFSLVVFVHHDQPYAWTEQELLFIRSFGDRIQNAIARLQAERDQQLLNHEIGHRLKNTFAMVQAIANQTLKPITDREHVTNFVRRLQALSSAHDMLLKGEHSRASIADIVGGFSASLGIEDRIDSAGPDIVLGSRATLSLSLLLHELATNAIKYGALSNSEGRVSVTWDVRDEGKDARFEMAWRERGGPPVREPENRGFGSKLIRMGLLGTGGVETRYDYEGFTAEMAASLAELQRAS